MMQTQVLSIQVNETPKAFRVNGVTIAKRHLGKTFTKPGTWEQKLARYLVIVPFLHEAFECPERASESVKYGATKAHRVYEAIGLNKESVVPFMLVCLAQSGDLPENLKNAGPELVQSFQVGEREHTDNVISFAQARANRTLH